MNVALNIGTRASAEQPEDLKGRYLVSLKLIERLHRLLLDVIKDEFERLGRSDVNSVQALLLYNIGDAELTAGELTSRGYYLGSNVSYNLKKLVECRLHQPPALEHRPPLGAGPPHRQGAGGLQGGERALPPAAQVPATGRRHRRRAILRRSTSR